jgi:DNA-directed RNA polymerase III subunit RPC8
VRHLPFSSHATNTCSVDAEQVWVWKSGGNDYWFDAGENVRFRIESEKWSNPNDEVSATAGGETADIKARAQVPYSLEGSMAEPGLGGVEWW